LIIVSCQTGLGKIDAVSPICYNYRDLKVIAENLL
jgi:hypothetical protein